MVTLLEYHLLGLNRLRRGEKNNHLVGVLRNVPAVESSQISKREVVTLVHLLAEQP